MKDSLRISLFFSIKSSKLVLRKLILRKLVILITTPILLKDSTAVLQGT